MNKSQLERIMGYLAAIEKIVEEDSGGAGEIKKNLGQLQGTVAQELKNTVWKEYLDATDISGKVVEISEKVALTGIKEPQG